MQFGIVFSPELLITLLLVMHAKARYFLTPRSNQLSQLANSDAVFYVSPSARDVVKVSLSGQAGILQREE